MGTLSVPASGANSELGSSSRRSPTCPTHSLMSASEARRPGTFARRRYEEGLRSYRRAVRPYVLALAGTSILLLAVAQEVWDVDVWAVAVLLAAGGALAMAVWVRDDPPDVVDRWRRGAEGERKTGKALEPLLAAGWAVKHDVELDGVGNVDHILLSPTGSAYVLDSKVLAGRLTLERGVLVQRFANGHSRRLHDLGRRMRERASLVAVEWSRRTGKPAPPVRPVVVIWGAFSGWAEVGGVVYAAGTGLVGTLTRLDEGG